MGIPMLNMPKAVLIAMLLSAGAASAAPDDMNSADARQGAAGRRCRAQVPEEQAGRRTAPSLNSVGLTALALTRDSSEPRRVRRRRQGRDRPLCGIHRIEGESRRLDRRTAARPELQHRGRDHGAVGDEGSEVRAAHRHGTEVHHRSPDRTRRGASCRSTTGMAAWAMAATSGPTCRTSTSRSNRCARPRSTRRTRSGRRR